ncbi:MAG: LLM class F420-dependent oxidoreductase [Deltaproteobacteria bacterium]|jgi:F420-dependent oxidoreductase-like protein|nr:LLM class F420-dependent oxidoreductase [Deltaproteobacteria bacterium]
MKLGLALPWAHAQVSIPVERVRLAEQLGFDSVWSAEIYGQDAITPLAYLAGQTSRIRLGTAVIQAAARAPSATALAMATLDQLAGAGRVILGIGLSGPQIVEGWYGAPWGRPNKRLRDYVTIMRKVLAREAPVEHDGEEIALPYRGPGASGLGKPLKSVLHTNPDIPIYLGTGQAANVKLTAELADGWLPMGYNPETRALYEPWIEEGLARTGRRREELRIQAGCQVILSDDVKGALQSLKPFIGFYVGGMGARSKNFHKEMMIRRGFPEAAEQIQELFLAGKRAEAFAAVPDEYVDQGALIGPKARIAERYRPWADLGLDGLTLHTEQEEALHAMAEIADLKPA